MILRHASFAPSIRSAMQLFQVAGSRLALAGIGVLSLLINLQGLDKAYYHLKGNRQDVASVSDNRLGSLKHCLPSRTVVGFLSDAISNANGLDHEMLYYSAQYSLAPLLVRNSPHCEYVVGRFRSRAEALKILNRYKLTEVCDLGDGAFLLRRLAE
jgi:hypothetical protein